MVLLAGKCARAYAAIVGLTPARVDLLLSLKDGNDMHQKELAATVGVTPPVVSRMLKALVALGLVEIRKLARDRRFHIVHLSALGEDAVKGIYDDIIVDDVHVQYAAEATVAGDFEAELRGAGIDWQPISESDQRSILRDLYERVRKRDYSNEWFSLPYARAKTLMPRWMRRCPLASVRIAAGGPAVLPDERSTSR